MIDLEKIVGQLLLINNTDYTQKIYYINNAKTKNKYLYNKKGKVIHNNYKISLI